MYTPQHATLHRPRWPLPVILPPTANYPRRGQHFSHLLVVDEREVFPVIPPFAMLVIWENRLQELRHDRVTLHPQTELPNNRKGTHADEGTTPPSVLKHATRRQESTSVEDNLDPSRPHPRHVFRASLPRHRPNKQRTTHPVTPKIGLNPKLPRIGNPHAVPAFTSSLGNKAGTTF